MIVAGGKFCCEIMQPEPDRGPVLRRQIDQWRAIEGFIGGPSCLIVSFAVEPAKSGCATEVAPAHRYRRSARGLLMDPEISAERRVMGEE